MSTYPTHVYFISDEQRRVKIGYATDVASRLGGLQSSNAGRLQVIRVLTCCGVTTERWLHKRFAAHRIQGEWFEFHPDMMTVVPPDEVPVRQVIKPRLSLTLKETLRNHDAYPIISDHEPRLLVTLLVQAMSDDDARDVIAWVRARCGLPLQEAEGVAA